MHRNKSVDVHQFAMVPRADIPRSRFRIQQSYKTSYDSGLLVPIFVKEVLPGDAFRCRMTAFNRLATPIVPIMDNLHFDSFFFFVPCRLVWQNWKRFMGEQPNGPGDSISFVIPKITSPAGGFVVGSIYDMMGLPTVGQIQPGNTININALPLRAYNLIYNEWFRDQNLQQAAVFNIGDGPDPSTNYGQFRRGKRPDYFTTALPWTQKGGVAVTLPLGSTAPVKTSASQQVSGAQPALTARGATAGGLPGAAQQLGMTAAGNVFFSTTAAGAFSQDIYPSNLYADLSAATSATINAIRTAFQIQRLLERDARGGTRYTESLENHFGVKSPDARLQRPEYLGGGSTPIAVHPVAQTSNTPVSGTPQGNLSAFAEGLAQHSFSGSFVEHGYIIGIINVRADLTYQQGIDKMWSRDTRYDFYLPVFQALGEQAILNKEIYADGGANDALTFGFQERWGEYRYGRSLVTGLMRSTAVGTIDVWHLAQKFTTIPTLNDTFIQDTPPLDRVLAVGAGANGKQLLLDAFFDIDATRPMPLYSVPGMVDHF